MTLPRGPEETTLTWYAGSRLGISVLALITWDAVQSPGVLDRWFTAQDVLSGFRSWREQASEVIEWLWAQRGRTGAWDFGKRASRSEFLPLSDDWRDRRAREHDWTTRVLLLLQRYHTMGQLDALRSL